MKVVSREYKLTVDRRPFQDRQAGVDAFWEDVSDLVKTVPGVSASGGFENKKKRRISFLDTADLSIRRVGLLLRERRDDEGEAEFTLKCRSEDRYAADGVSLRAASGSDPEEKLEEDIAAPFRPRYSHSSSVSFKSDFETPRTLGEAGTIYPILNSLKLDGREIASGTTISRVNNLIVYERVYTGPKLAFGEKDPSEASVALIVWSAGEKGRSLIAEFSFRIKDKTESYARGPALAARSFFETLARLDWFPPNASTKTEFVYRDRGGD